MDKKITPHAIWFLIAIAAFALGKKIESKSKLETNKLGLTEQEQRTKSLSIAGKNNGIRSQIKSLPTSKNTSTASAPTNQLINNYLSSSDPIEKNLLFAQMLIGLNADNASEIYESLKENLDGRERSRKMELFFQAWGRADGESAIKMALSNNSERNRGRGGQGNNMYAYSALSAWASVDPESAMKTISNLEDDRQKSFLTYGLINGLAKSDARAATDYVLEMEANRETEEQPNGVLRRGDVTQRYISQIASEQLKKGVSTAIEWAEALPDGELKSSAFDQVTESYVRSDIDAAKKWVSSNAEKEYAQRAVSEVASHLSRENPQDAVDWASSLPTNAQGQAYREVMQNWTRNDPEAASNHLVAMKPSEARDSAVSSFAASLDREDPKSAATWAATIDNEETRINTLKTVAQSWMRTDAETAKAWLPNSGLPQETQTAILETPTRGRPTGDFRSRRLRQR